MENNTSPIPIGSIVALKSHPFFSDSDSDSVLISGEPTMISPLMVVTEILLDRKPFYEDHTGMEISNKETYQCKCIWYSLKSHQFEEVWLSSRLIKKINQFPDSVANIEETFAYGTTVSLKTNRIELGKKKSSFKKSSKDQDNLTTTTGLLSFTSPAMQVIGNVKNESKEPLIDQKTGLTKRWISNKLVKCKYYNPQTDKLSEIILPTECLNPIVTADTALIESLKEMILNSILFKSKSTSGLITILKPIAIHFKAGMHFLECKDYVMNTVSELQIHTKSQFLDKTRIEEYLPRFERTKSMLDLKEMNVDNLKKLPQDKLWRITYKDNQDVITKRTIFNPDYLIYRTKGTSSRTTKRIDYIKANCLLRNRDERYFRVDRITLLEVLDIESSNYMISQAPTRKVKKASNKKASTLKAPAKGLPRIAKK